MSSFLYISDDELERARERVHKPSWRPAIDGLRASAERALERNPQMPAWDSAWYDAQPDRDYGETYVLFHDYIRPATRLLSGAHTLLIAGKVLQESRYLEAAKAWAQHVTEHGRFHVRHHDAGMAYSGMADGLGELYCVLGEQLGEGDRQGLRKALEACGEAVAVNSRHWAENLARMPYNNHLACHARGLLAAGLAAGRREWIDAALDGPKSFGRLLVGATYDDGLCYESSTGYHFATLHFLLQIAELARHSSHLSRDLYREPLANGRTLKDMFDAPLGMLLPNGELPALGDCYANRSPLWRRAAATYELGFAVYGDPRYAWLLGQAGERSSLNALLHGVDGLPPGEAVPCRSRLWLEHGYGLLACPEEAPEAAAVLTGDRSGVHNHRDSLSLQLFAGGYLWTEDVESRAVEAHSFSAPIQRAFNRTMLAHNLVVVDERDQQGLQAPLSVTRFSTLPSCHTMEMADGSGRLYPGVRMQRTVACTPDYVLDVLQVASGSEHTYDWLVHPRADGPVATGLDFTAALLPERAPYEVLRGAEVADAPKQGVVLTWAQEDARFRMDVLAGQDGRLYRAKWPVSSDWSDGGRELLMYRVLAASVDFIAVGQVLEDDEPWRVASSERAYNGAHDEIRVSMVRGDEAREHVVEGIGEP